MIVRAKRVLREILDEQEERTSEGSERSELPNAIISIKLTPSTRHFAPRLTPFDPPGLTST